MSKMMGIELGRRKCCVAVLEGGEAKVMPNAEGNRTTASVIGLKNGEGEVGEVGKGEGMSKGNRMIWIKGEMGREDKVEVE
ncbi:Hsp70 family protein, partial [Cytobacillus oceanisediminis]|uniref:Hsp70 family protein n=1 Tax=Cytobacillus oceanisediminis TaxID=665099 RepID=UPI0011A0BD05